MKVALLLMTFLMLSCNKMQQVDGRSKLVYTTPTGMRFIFIKAGTSILGDGSKERPFRKAWVSNYWICEHETRFRDIHGLNSSKPIGAKASSNFPVAGFNYQQILQLIKELSARDGLEYKLPGEVQWEYAARSGRKGETYPWGNHHLTKSAQVGEQRSCEVKAFLPNDFGLYDIVGNVAELVAEAYVFESEPGRKPGDPDFRTSRGGGFGLIHAPISWREPVPPTDASLWFDTGFRLVLDDNLILHEEAKRETF